jgi:catechol 2,3-dioxygenase-like lactoylglutathione lyase family enzyme
MKRMHVHVAIENLQQSIGFYSTLFDAEPAVVKPDYAKWMLDDPRVNFAISTRGREPGLDHLGIQVENQAELHEVYARLRKAGGNVVEQGQTSCCYAKSEKSWIDDPAGISGRLSTRPENQSTMARAPANATLAWRTPNHAARQRSLSRRPLLTACRR